MKIKDIYGNDKDIYGNDHYLTPHHVRVMLGVGWACFLGSWLINIAYYKFHPSAVEFELSRSEEIVSETCSLPHVQHKYFYFFKGKNLLTKDVPNDARNF